MHRQPLKLWNNWKRLLILKKTELKPWSQLEWSHHCNSGLEIEDTWHRWQITDKNKQRLITYLTKRTDFKIYPWFQDTAISINDSNFRRLWMVWNDLRTRIRFSGDLNKNIIRWKLFGVPKVRFTLTLKRRPKELWTAKLYRPTILSGKDFMI